MTDLSDRGTPRRHGSTMDARVLSRHDGSKEHKNSVRAVKEREDAASVFEAERAKENTRGRRRRSRFGAGGPTSRPPAGSGARGAPRRTCRRSSHCLSGPRRASARRRRSRRRSGSSKMRRHVHEAQARAQRQFPEELAESDWCAASIDESTDVSDSQNAGICVFFVKNGEASCAHCICHRLVSRVAGRNRREGGSKGRARVARSESTIGRIGLAPHTTPKPAAM